MDDRTRIAYAEAHPDERQETAVAFIGRAINWFADHGITVERVMTDNGTCYRSHAFANTLTAAGVGHLRTRPYRPQTNGKVERLNLTLKHEWAYVTAYPSNQARLDALAHWLHHYNHHRAHTALGGRPPISRVNNPPGSYS